MQSRQLQYALVIARTRSFSQAAQELNITQPALSKQIISLESNLGVKLFDRATTPISLTPAGEHFLSRAQKLLFEEEQLLKTMEQYKTGESGKLVIGISPFRSLYLMPDIVLALKKRFPGLQIVLNEQNSAQLHKGIMDGSYDFAIMNLPVDESQLDVTLLEKDVLVLAVHRSLAGYIRWKNKKPAASISMAECASLPFVTLGAGQELRLLFDKLCAHASITPQIEVEVNGVATAWSMVQAGIGAAILPRQFLGENSQVILLPLSQNTYVRQPAVVTKHQQYISLYAQYAIDLLIQRNQ